MKLDYSKTKELIVESDKYKIRLLSQREWTNMMFDVMERPKGDVMYDYLPLMIVAAPGLKLKNGARNATVKWAEDNILPSSAMILFAKAIEFQKLTEDTIKNLHGQPKLPKSKKTKKASA